MGLKELIFGEKPKELKGAHAFKMLNGYMPAYSDWNGALYESELVRAAIDTRARHSSKLKFTSSGSAKSTLITQLKKAPNSMQTWSQFLYRISTILDVKNNAFIVPIIGKYGETIGICPICPIKWELVEHQGVLWIRFLFKGNERGAAELDKVGILTKFQYESDFFGSRNNALDDTMELIHIQKQGIEEYAKNSNSYRFMARVTNFIQPEDLSKERQRFDVENFQKKNGGGVLLFPNTYNDIKELSKSNFVINANQLKLIQTNVYNYFGVSEEVIQNRAYGDEFNAFYEGAIEPFSIQLSEVMTKMIYSEVEQGYGNQIAFTANRLQFMSNAEKRAMATEMVDRGIFTINDALSLWDLPPVEDGDIRVIRGEYVNADEKISEVTE